MFPAPETSALPPEEPCLSAWRCSQGFCSPRSSCREREGSGGWSKPTSSLLLCKKEPHSPCKHRINILPAFFLLHLLQDGKNLGTCSFFAASNSRWLPTRNFLRPLKKALLWIIRNCESAWIMGSFPRDFFFSSLAFARRLCIIGLFF